MNIITLEFTPFPYPYIDQGPYDRSIVWGRICIQVRNSTNVVLQTIVDWQWDIRPLIEWFLDFKNDILTERIPFILNTIPGETIAEKLDNFYSDDTDFPDEEYGIVRNYWARHDYSYGLPGIDAPNVLFGLNNDTLEVSCKRNQVSWSYLIDLEPLFATINEIVTKFNIEFDDEKMYII